MSKKFTLALILLVSTLAVPITSVAASDNKTAIDVHRQAIEELRQEQEELQAASKELEAVSEATIKKVAEIDIDALVAKYESALAKTTQQIRSQYETKIQQIQSDHAKREAAYENKLRQATELADRALWKSQRQERQVEKLLNKLGAYGGKVERLVDAVSVSRGGNVGIGTTSPRTKLDINGDVKVKNSLSITGSIFPHVEIVNYTEPGGQEPVLIMKNYGGTYKVPTATKKTTLGTIIYGGHNGEEEVQSARIAVRSTGDFWLSGNLRCKKQ
ncbi:hypothetical protein [Candidatus Parabeggiatoa sp. HSG14]|uniref:hypothetical protein n=1 Tax=Candidatus Parabeggiatoa sp. HSG14 TaxID=3055593 RepID=UPI0025A725DE|nr:hypothetical protein [Thiotrichales bacterium HSG14]